MVTRESGQGRGGRALRPEPLLSLAPSRRRAGASDLRRDIVARSCGGIAQGTADRDRQPAGKWPPGRTGSPARCRTGRGGAAAAAAELGAVPPRRPPRYGGAPAAPRSAEMPPTPTTVTTAATPLRAGYRLGGQAKPRPPRTSP